MRILLSTLHFGFLRNFEPVLRALASRGHELHLVADRRDALGGDRIIQVLQSEFPGRVSSELVSGDKERIWHRYAQSVRGSIDFLRYLDPRYSHATKLSARAADYAAWPVRQLNRLPVSVRYPSAAIVSRVLRILERSIPPRASVETLLDRHRPDVLLLTPLLYFGCQQVDYVRAARSRGIPNVLGVGSWDHLTTKGAIHEIPDAVVVWNAAQATEAVELHNVPRDRIVVTGAQAYDHWFTRRPTLSREEFFHRVGLQPERPMVLYLCSSPFIAPNEVGFVRRWVQAIRASDDPVVRTVNVLIRPHPQNAEQWVGVDLADMPGAALWPKGGANPIDELARSDYYHSMHFSAAVVGVNTSAQVESSILGRPVLTVLSPDFSQTQEGTLHFQHLNSGLLRVGKDLDEHVGQLAEILRNPGVPDARSQAFVASFVRPHGRDVPATGLFVDAIEHLAARESAGTPVPVPLSAAVVRTLSLPAAALAWLASGGLSKMRRTPKQKPVQAGKRAAGKGTESPGASGKRAR